MELKQLAYFTQVYRDRSFTKAAAHCFITQQGLSMAISRLERELNCTLFERNNNSLIPTIHADFLLARAQKILELESECNNYFNIKDRIPSLYIGALSEAIGLCPPGVQSFLQKGGSDTMFAEMEYTDAYQCEAGVANRKYDFGITSGPIDPTRFDNDFLFSQRHVILVNQKHPLASQEFVNLSQLKDEKWIQVSRRNKLCKVFEQRCAKKYGYVPDVVVESDWPAVTYNMVKANPHLIGRSFDYIAKMMNDKEVKALIIDDEEFTWDIYLIYRARENLRSSQRMFREFILNEIRHRNI